MIRSQIALYGGVMQGAHFNMLQPSAWSIVVGRWTWKRFEQMVQPEKPPVQNGRELVSQL
jgi:hypothetical protein